MVGMHGYISNMTGEPGINAFLQGQGLYVGAEAKVLVIGADGDILLDLGGRFIALAADVAAHITFSSTRSKHATRQASWARCISFWLWVRGENCACGFLNVDQ